MIDRDEIPTIAVDGPGGAGKGTVCQAVARELGWHLLDSGALYRLVALSALNRRVDLDDEAALMRLAANLDVRFAADQVYLDGLVVTSDIRAEACGQAASRVAAQPAVREALVHRQRQFRQAPGLVADGRDMGAVIFPTAGLKIFLTASVEERALRRYKQLKEKGIGVSLPALSRDMAERDRRDSERAVAPLRPCLDARRLDTTDMPVAAVIAQVLQWARDVFPDVMND